MTTHRLFHVGIRPDGPLDRARLEKAFDFAGDWLRLNDFNWYVWTTDRAMHLNELVKPLIGQNGSVVILQIDTSAESDRWGSAPTAVWEWIDDKRDKAVLAH